MNQNIFTDRIEQQEIILKKNYAISDIVGYTKLLLVILTSISLYLLFTKNISLTLIAVSSAEMLALVILWVFHNKIHEKINYSKGIIAINQKHLDRIADKWVNFTDIGAEFINANHPYSGDLDIVGKKSLFQFLNATHTWHGRQSFAGDLLQPHFSKEQLIKRQEAIEELAGNIDFSNHMEYGFSKIGVDSSAQKLVEELKDRCLFIESKVLKYLLTYAPLFTFASITAVTIFSLKSLYIPAASAGALQAVIWLIGMVKTKRYLTAASRLPRKLNAYTKVIHALKGGNFRAETLKQIQARLGIADLSAAQALKELDRIADKVSVRNNGMVWFILNVLLLWDYKCAILFEKWKIKYSHAAEEWFLALGEFESLLCFSILPNVCGNTCLPSVVSGKQIEAKELGHPLILNEIRVNNDAACNNNIFIISGSNMSGKTTFLRTAGINLVLAKAGSFVCAKQMNFSPLEIITSMRIADDLNEGVSTFYAELKRIKEIVQTAEKDPHIIFLIDEIFRGTNSVDRLNGAKTVISKLNELAVIGMITTHDLELCEIADQYPRIKNYSFSEYYRDSHICFDYKIKSGKSVTTNAKYLMEMVGIL